MAIRTPTMWSLRRITLIQTFMMLILMSMKPTMMVFKTLVAMIKFVTILIRKKEDKTIDTDHHKLSHGDDTTDINDTSACIDNTDDARNELDYEANLADECQSSSSMSSGAQDDSDTNFDRYILFPLTVNAELTWRQREVGTSVT